MACFFALSALSTFLSGRPYYLAFAAVLPLVRTDFVILTILLVVCGLISGRRLAATVTGSVAVAFYLGVNKVMGNYGWLTIFNFTLIGYDPYPAEMMMSGSLLDYVRPFAADAWVLGNHVHGLIYFLAFSIWFYSRRKIEFNKKSKDYALMVSLIFVVLHLLAFSAYMDRFFTFAAAFCLMFIFSKVKKIWLL